jgi:hypothetical protein
VAGNGANTYGQIRSSTVRSGFQMSDNKNNLSVVFIALRYMGWCCDNIDPFLFLAATRRKSTSCPLLNKEGDWGRFSRNDATTQRKKIIIIFLSARIRPAPFYGGHLRHPRSIFYRSSIIFFTS